MQSSEISIYTLPSELINLIFKNLISKNYFNFLSTSKYFYENDVYWKFLLVKQIRTKDVLQVFSKADFFTSYHDLIKLLFNLDNFEFHVKNLFSEDMMKQYLGCASIRIAFSLTHVPDEDVSELVSFACIERLVALLDRFDQDSIIFEAAWALMNIAFFGHREVKCMVDLGCIQKFLKLLDYDSDEIREHAIWALGNISGENKQFKDMIINQGGLEILIKDIMTHSTTITVLCSAWTLANLVRDDYEFDPTPIIDVCKHFLNKPDCHPEVLEHLCWVLSHISEKDEDQIDLILQCDGLIARLLVLLTYPVEAVQYPVLRTIGNIATGTADQTQYLVNAGIIKGLWPLIRGDSQRVTKESIWILSNITAGTTDQIQAVIDSGIFLDLRAILIEENTSPETTKEICWVFSNSTNGLDKQIRYIADTFLEDIPRLLVKASSATEMTILLECLTNIFSLSIHAQGIHSQEYLDSFEAGGYLNILEELIEDSQMPVNVMRMVENVLDFFVGVGDFGLESYSLEDD